jgi:uncharacterized protein DUF4129
MRGNAVRALLPALVVLSLVAIVAIAATGSTPTGTEDSRPPEEAILDTILSIGMLLLVPAAIIFVYGLLQRKAIQREIASGRYPRSGLGVFFGFLAVLCFLSWYRFRDWERVVVEDEFGERAFPGALPRPQESAPPETYEPEFALIPVLVVVGLATIAIVAAAVALRRKHPPPRDEGMAAALAAVLDDTLDDLRAEKDPRKAIIAAYARLERTFAAHGLPRRLHETPEEYLARVGSEVELGQRSLRRLTDLFTRAKFSPHDVDAGMKDEAIDALSTVRDELKAAADRRLEEQMKELRAAAEGA